MSLRTACRTSIQSRQYSREAPPVPTRAVMANGTDEELQLLLLLELQRRQKRRKGLKYVQVRSVLVTAFHVFSLALASRYTFANNQMYEQPQQASPRPSFFPSVPPFFHHVARLWFTAIMHSDWSNVRPAEHHDAGIEIKSIRASLHEHPQHRMFTIGRCNTALVQATQRWF